MKEVDSYKPEERLIAYGSLAPGGVNAFLLERLEGTWHQCRVWGHMGRCRGFKAFKWDPEGSEHLVWLLVSPALPQTFPELDDFEGEEYRRIVIPAQVADHWVMAQIYEGQYFD